MFYICGRPDCVWCQRAKDFLLERAEPFQYIEITPDNLSIFQANTLGAKTVPQILWDHRLVGGYDDMKKMWYTVPKELFHTYIVER